jgi:integrase
MAKKLGVLQIEKLIKQGKKGAYSVGGGLYLSISKGGTASWLFRYTLHGKARWKGLGPYNSVNSLKKMTRKAEECRAMLHDGIDPIEAERDHKAATAGKNAEAQHEAMLDQMTFSRCAEDYIQIKKSGWKNKKHIQQWQNTLKTYAYPVIGDLPVREIQNTHLLKILNPIWSTKTETATRVRTRVELVLSYAAALKYRSTENPAQWRGNLETLLTKPGDMMKVRGGRRHHAALPYDDLPNFMVELMAQDGLGAKALELTILCATRTSETIAAEWSEFDLDGATWIIPAVRMKKSKEHRIPLCTKAVEILEEMKAYRVGRFVFPSMRKVRGPEQPMSTAAMSSVLKRMERLDITVHGFRSTFRDWVAERTSFPDRVAEMALAHKLKDGVEAAYQRGDLMEKRKDLMNAWADYCLPKMNNVTRIRA